MSNSAILAFVAAIFGGATALVAGWQERRSRSHWIFTAGMFLLALESVFICLSANAETSDAGIRWGTFIKWETCKAVTASMLPSVWLCFGLSYARGNAREFLKNWRMVLGAALVIPAGLALWFREGFFAPEQIGFAQQWMLRLTLPGVAFNLTLLLSYVLVLMNLERTFRASVGTMRWRIKFMVLGLGALFLARAYTSSQILLFNKIDPALDSVDAGGLLVGSLLICRSLLRTGHFEVNVYPSHSVIHHSLILVLGGVYLLIVGLFANLLGADASFTLKAFILLLGLVLLTVLLLSDRARLYTKRFVSRHFQRPMYDYHIVWRRYTETTASRMDQAELCRAVTGLVAEVFQVLSVTIWTVDETTHSLAFAASTSLTKAQGTQLTPGGSDAAEVLRAFQSRTEPVFIDAAPEQWAAILRRCQPDEFHKGGGRICVPLTVGGEVLGLMTLGDRIGGMALTHQDLDLLKCVGDQAGANLRNLQLSAKLLQAKEMEAFQTMSAFFVHDLKNTASSLGLMLKNLPVHFNDPAFREDALRGVSKTVNHINNLIARLSLLRHGLEIRRTDSDLNDIINKVLAANKDAFNGELVTDLQPVPKIPLDPEQVGKVMTNLVLNATEAVSKQGRIRIYTSRINGWVFVEVSDNGCGMSPEFLNRSLFRPFQTTKKAGLGIGMFQSKMIIEAHGGRIEVESEAGKGTTFRVLLPLNKSK